MIRVSREDAERIFWSDWRTRKVWIGTTVILGDEGKEEHRFWAQVSVRDDELILAGEHALVTVPLADAIFEYGEPIEAPVDRRALFSGFGCLFTIRSKSVVAFLFGGKPNEELDTDKPQP